MTLWDVINAAREAYLQAYRQTIRAQRDKLAELAPETMVAINGAHDIPADYRLFRADLMWREEGTPKLGTIGAPETSLSAPLETRYPDGGQVTIASFRWDECLIVATPAITDDAHLRSWLRQWIDRVERNPTDAEGLRGAVHSMTPPHPVPNGASLIAVDFGSAPPEAFTKLISTLFASGATTITIGQAPAT